GRRPDLGPGDPGGAAHPGRHGRRPAVAEEARVSAEATAPERQPPLRRALDFLADHPELALLVVLFGLMVATHFASENGFFRLSQLGTTLQIAGPLVVIASGQ